MFVGLGFKGFGRAFPDLGADVYQGAPTPISAFMSAGPKAAAFAVSCGFSWERSSRLERVGSRSFGFGAALHDHRHFAALTQSTSSAS